MDCSLHGHIFKNFAGPQIPGGSYEYVPSQMRIISKSALLLGLSFLLIGIGIAIRQHHWYSVSSLCHLSTDQSFELEFVNTLGFNQVRASDIQIKKLGKDTSITSRASSVTFPIGSRLKFQYNEKFLISTVVWCRQHSKLVANMMSPIRRHPCPPLLYIFTTHFIYWSQSDLRIFCSDGRLEASKDRSWPSNIWALLDKLLSSIEN